jgi:branched-chain amino acid transport system substrate-binding protein
MRRALAVLAVAAGAIAGLAAAHPFADPGVTSAEVVIGGTVPLTGEGAAAGALARGAEAYFKWVNAHGKVQGRDIRYRYLDDGDEPVKALVNVRGLVERDRVFAVFNTFGTEQNLALRPYLNEGKVPQLFVASGYSGWGRDARRYPWTLGFVPTYVAEGQTYGRYLASTKPSARIAVLYEDGAYGRDLLAGLRRGLGARVGNIVRAVGYDPDSASSAPQVAELARTRAHVLMCFAFGRFAVQAFIGAHRAGWQPQVFVNAVASSPTMMTVANGLAGKRATTGAVSAAYAKDPADPAWTDDPGLSLFTEVMKAGGLATPANLRNGYYVAGMASAFALVDALRKAGPRLTRQGLLKATRNLNEADNPFLLPGIVVKTGPNDPYPVEQLQLMRWSGTRWVRFGGLVTAKT